MELITISPSIAFMDVGKLIKDYGTPIRCQQLGLIEARGEYIHRAVDDATYLPGAMDRAMALAKEDTVVNLKFIEWNSSINQSHQAFQNMNDPNFYNLRYHNQTHAHYIPHNFKLINFGIYPTKLLNDIGGWDCQFETIAVGELDLGIRLQFWGAKTILSDEVVLKCEWMPGESGDHKPIHDGFFVDMEIYKKIYNQPSCEDRIKIPLDNWKKSPEKWARRFG